MRNFLALLFVAFALSVQAFNVNLIWSPSANPRTVGYDFYYGTQSQNYTNKTDVGLVTNNVVTGLQAGTTYYFSCSTYDNHNVESSLCPEVAYTIPTVATNSYGITNIFLGNGTLPYLGIFVLSWSTNYIIPPDIETNQVVTIFTNNSIVTMSTNYVVWTNANAYTLSANQLLVASDMIIATNWTIQTTPALKYVTSWTTLATGSNGAAYCIVTNSGGNAFFRLKI